LLRRATQQNWGRKVVHKKLNSKQNLMQTNIRLVPKTITFVIYK